MSGKYQRYPAYKESGVEWLGDVPEHWDIKKLKFIANVHPSNVDKKTNASEIPVLLCNYTDVYYNDTVNASMEFMNASATEEQIKKFTLQAGDTIITKDSEDPNDIAIPAFVPENMAGVICGYHLSIIRPHAIAYSAYIKRVFECGYARAYFATRSNGLTRYGLGTYPLDNVCFPKPTKEEAAIIANFLDHETAKINTLIEKQRRLIELLKEKRQAVISHAVTKGLNPNAPMKDSGVEWLGEVPEHWRVCAIKHQLSSLDFKRIPLSAEERGSRSGEFRYYGASGVIDYIDDYIFDESTVLVGEDGANLVNRSTPLAFSAHGKYWVNNHAHILKSDDGLADYWAETIEHIDINPLVSGSAQPKLTAENLNNLKIVFPPSVEERIEIDNFISEIKSKFDFLMSKAKQQIELLQERRTALISAAVTGKIDVRNWKVPPRANWFDNYDETKDVDVLASIPADEASEEWE